MPHRNQYESQEGVKHQDFAGEERSVDKPESQQEDEPPHIPVSEVFAPFLAITALQVEGKAEEQGEDSVCFP